MKEEILINKLSKILNVPEDQIKWDMSYQEIILDLVGLIEAIAEKVEVDLYE